MDPGAPEAVREHVVRGDLSAGHARALITAPNAEELAAEVIAKGLNVRQTEALARRAAEGPKTPKARPVMSGEGAADIAALEQDLSDALGLKVSLSDKGGKGEITVKYGTLEDVIEQRKSQGIGFTEKEVAKIIKSILSGIAYIHKKGYVHADIKTINILMADKFDTSKTKIIDFGISQKIQGKA